MHAGIFATRHECESNTVQINTKQLKQVINAMTKCKRLLFLTFQWCTLKLDISFTVICLESMTVFWSRVQLVCQAKLQQVFELMVVIHWKWKNVPVKSYPAIVIGLYWKGLCYKSFNSSLTTKEEISNHKSLLFD